MDERHTLGVIDFRCWAVDVERDENGDIIVIVSIVLASGTRQEIRRMEMPADVDILQDEITIQDIFGVTPGAVVADGTEGMH